LILAADVVTSGQLQLWIIVVYLAALIALGIASNRLFRGTALDYFVASRGIGPVLLVLSVFGTTMTAFAIQGSSGEAWVSGVAVYGKMASWSGIIHAACFFLIGVKLWSFGKRYGFQTQIQFFRERFESSGLGLVLFPVLVLLQMPYIIIGIIGAGNMIRVATRGAFPSVFHDTGGGVPFWLGTFLSTGVVWLYVWLGGARATAWANALQTIIFLIVGIVTFWVIADRLGGAAEATRLVQEYNPSKLTRAVTDEHWEVYEQKMAAWRAATQPTSRSEEAADGPAAPAVVALRPHKPREMTELEFFSYGAIPLSVAMFPHLFQLWLTARSARTFRLTVSLHPVLIMLIWAPCVAIGVWATSAIVGGLPVVPFTPEGALLPGGREPNPNQVLALMVQMLGNPVVSGLLAAGVLAAILGGMDAQFLCLGSMFTHDIVDHYAARNRMSDRQRLLSGRIFVILIVLASWLLTLWLKEARPIFGVAIWCFSGFAALFPLVFAALYWRRTTKAGAYASVICGIGLGLYYYVRSGLAQGWGGGIDPLVALPGLDPEWKVVPAVPMVALAALALVLVSLLTRPPASATVRKFFDVASRA
jgi:SSS family solute:Na+ symporter